MKPHNLYEQLDDGAKLAVGYLIGVDVEGPSFRNYLRDIDVLPEGFTVGDAARAYLQSRIKVINSL